MLVAQYKIDDEIYDIETSENTDCVVSDAEIVEQYLESIGDKLLNKDEYINRMMSAVNDGMCIKIKKDGITYGFLYCKNSPKRDIVDGCSVYSAYGMKYIVCILKETLMMNPSIRHFNIVPHGNNIKNFISICERKSLRRYNSGMSNYVSILASTKINIFAKYAKYMKIERIKVK